ncbi:MAG: flagellar biosynthesis protein FlgB [Rubricella sp.]
MSSDLEILRTASALISHSAQRQSVIATNVAHADTPGYRARDVVPFAEVLARGLPETGRGAFALRNPDTPGTVSPDGNSVTLEDQMVRGVEAQRAHSRALTIYGHSIDILRLALGRGR